MGYDRKNWDEVSKAFEIFQKVYPDNANRAAQKALDSEYDNKNWDQVNKAFEFFQKVYPDKDLAAEWALKSKYHNKDWDQVNKGFEIFQKVHPNYTKSTTAMQALDYEFSWNQT